MFELSQAKNTARWEPTAELRKGQQALYELISNTDKDQYTIQLPTGYGKSWCACIAYAVLKDKGRVNRALIVVPTDQQRSQYVEGLAEDLGILGVSYRGIEQCDNKDQWVIKHNIRNKADIFVAGVQSISADPHYYEKLMAKGSWLVVADEYHHYAEDNSWGKAVEGLSFSVMLGMSATPMRRDKKSTILGMAEFDICVSIAAAYEEKAVRRIRGVVGDYIVSWSCDDQPDPQNSLMSELSQEWGSGISEYELKRRVRYYDKYVSTIFLKVINAWIEYEYEYPDQNQILVFAMSCKHAEMITRIINDLAFPGMPTPFADWIGVGEGEEQQRSPEQNKRILDQFQQNKLKCLVQVNKAGEGFNNKRCSILLMLDLIGDTPMKRQHIGRAMRVNPNAPDQDALVFISEDSPCKALLEDLERELKGKGSNGSGGGNGSGESEPTIPDIFVIDVQHHSDRIVYPFGSPQAAMKAFLNSQSSVVQNAYSSLPEDRAQSMLMDAMTEWLKNNQKSDLKPMTSKERREQIATQVNRNTGILVNHYLYKRYGKSIPKSVKGDAYALVHRQWAKDNGCYTNEMCEEELRSKNRWLQELHEEIKAGNIPTWLSL